MAKTKSKSPDKETLPQEKIEKVEVKKLLKDERTHKIAGSVCLLLAIFLFIAFTSYLFTWDEDQDKVFQSGSRLLIAAILYKDFPFKTTLWAGRLFIIGIILFSGSLYFLTWVKAAVIPGYNYVGAITPFGGLAFIAGWICLFVSAIGKRQS